MTTYKVPAKLNGEQLLAELKAVGIELTEVRVVADELFLDTDNKKAVEVVANHVGVDTVDSSIAAKAALLERLGITAEEAKLLLA